MSGDLAINETAIKMVCQGLAQYHNCGLTILVAAQNGSKTIE